MLFISCPVYVFVVVVIAAEQIKTSSLSFRSHTAEGHPHLCLHVFSTQSPAGLTHHTSANLMAAGEVMTATLTVAGTYFASLSVVFEAHLLGSEIPHGPTSAPITCAK